MDVGSEQRLLFVGLGNPGKTYESTRHNLGFMVIDEFSRLQGWSWQEDRWFDAKVAKGLIGGKKIDLLKPMTFMNLSGWSIKQYVDYYKIALQQIVIISDDTALPYGQMRVRLQGSSGGHNGIKSAISELGSEGFIRLRMGIGQQALGQQLADYVLNDFTAEQKLLLADFIKQGAAVLDAFTRETVTQVMNKVNTK